jgi:hypothetical protein
MFDQRLSTKNRIIGLGDDLYVTLIACIENVVNDRYFRKIDI